MGQGDLRYIGNGGGGGGGEVGREGWGGIIGWISIK